ncbi:MAG: HTTM domain-containing protein, partial [Patescibacteria group bacterium]
FALRIPYVPILYSKEGLTLPYDFSLVFPSSPPLLLSILSSVLTPPSVWIAYLLFAALLASLLCFTLGIATRTSACIASLLYFYYIELSFHQGMTSYIRLFFFLLLLFTFSDAGKTFSYEMWRKHGSIFAWEPGSVLVQRLIALQITATYLGVGWQKSWLPDWQGGEVLYYSFQSMWATPVAWWFVRERFPMWVYDGMVILVTYFEAALPFGLWIRKLRPWFMFGGVLFHLGISLFLAAIWWFYAMIAAYITFFEPEEVYERLQVLGVRYQVVLKAEPRQC